MTKAKLDITIKNIRLAYKERRIEIEKRIDEFSSILCDKDDGRLFEEMVFCFFTGGCSAKMGLNSVDAVRHLLENGTHEELATALVGHHRYPNARSRYIVHTREYLKNAYSMRIFDRLDSFADPIERRDWLVKDKGIKGLGYKEASHYLRNIGYKGYAILDKHVLNCLYELKIIDSPIPPKTRSVYLKTEQSVKRLSKRTGIDFDELDLVLWSMKTGTILK